MFDVHFYVIKVKWTGMVGDEEGVRGEGATRKTSIETGNLLMEEGPKSVFDSKE